MPTVPKKIIDTLIGEAIGEGSDGMRYVAHSIINRAEVRGQDPEDVVTAPKQYSGYYAPGPSAAKSLDDPVARAMAEEAYIRALNEPDPLNGADHYLSHGFTTSWSPKMETTATNLGGHDFFASDQASKKKTNLRMLDPPTPVGTGVMGGAARWMNGSGGTQQPPTTNPWTQDKFLNGAPAPQVAGLGEAALQNRYGVNVSTPPVPTVQGNTNPVATYQGYEPAGNGYAGNNPSNPMVTDYGFTGPNEGMFRREPPPAMGQPWVPGPVTNKPYETARLGPGFPIPTNPPFNPLQPGFNPQLPDGGFGRAPVPQGPLLSRLSPLQQQYAQENMGFGSPPQPPRGGYVPSPMPLGARPGSPFPLPPTMRPNAGSGSPPPSAPGSYTVQPGDTLAYIANRFGTSVGNLASLNGIGNPNFIKAGQTLSLTGSPRAPVPMSVRPGSPGKEGPKTSNGNQNGPTLQDLINSGSFGTITPNQGGFSFTGSTPAVEGDPSKGYNGGIFYR